ncbi:probable inactive serine protease 37 isoform X1 [Sarcophilus harrisii]|uniref:probable inactive serine protease 37 isoform X1 n=1 Tax=Sarcophilus harrisii TaxID=9305 RepID=UPI000273C107|nr:probable inactive serine protease 37 isoform X1 [Sarcophilus harrisii]
MTLSSWEWWRCLILELSSLDENKALSPGVPYSDTFSSNNKAEQKDDPAPYLVYFKSPINPCVGVLIHQQWVLAASHCYLSNLILVLGNFKIGMRDRTEQIFSPMEVIRYWNESDKYQEHDIMLLKLPKPVTLSHKVQPIALPTRNFPTGTKCTVSGLDWSMDNIGKHPDLQQNIEASLISEKECKQTKRGRIIKHGICVKFLKTLTRLFVELAVATVICQNTTQGIEVGHFLGENIGVYTNIYYYVPWIQNIMSTR